MAAKTKAKAEVAPGGGTIALNRRARYDYEILQRFEAGIVLTGSEIKAVREHKVNIAGSYARIKDGEVWLQDAHIAPYQSAGYAGHNPTRDRKLLLHRREIVRLQQLLGEQSLTLIPLAMYFKNGRAKVELGVARGLRKYDKRDRVAERESNRDIARALRRNA